MWRFFSISSSYNEVLASHRTPRFTARPPSFLFLLSSLGRDNREQQILNRLVVCHDLALSAINLGSLLANFFFELSQLVLEWLQHLLGNFLLLDQLLLARLALFLPVVMLLAHRVNIVSDEINTLAERIGTLTEHLNCFLHELNILLCECARCSGRFIGILI